MKILFFGDSITDMGRNREPNSVEVYRYGCSYVFFVAGELTSEDPNAYEIVNRGNGGNRTVDLYARIKSDVWNENPDVFSILIGINDVWHELAFSNGVDIERYERMYRMIIEDTLARLPKLKIMLMEPFMLEGPTTSSQLGEFRKVFDYAKVVKKLADEYGLIFVPLQKKLDEAAARFGSTKYLDDGVHPTTAGAKLIADEWLKAYRGNIR